MSTMRIAESLVTGAISMSRRAILVAAVSAALILALLPPPPASAEATTASIGGVAFQDLNRDGAYQPDEAGFPDLVVYLFDSEGTYLGSRRSNEVGRYDFGAVPPGEYVVALSSPSWRELRADWVPTTTGSLMPRRRIVVSGPTSADLGWRPIERSDDIDAPLSTFTGPSGLRVASYNDVVEARDIHDVLLRGELIGQEASSVTIRHDWGSTSSCATSASRRDGRYSSFAAICYIDWMSWLTGGERTLFHEYGHAWSLYHAYMTQQDPSMASYLEFREIADDPRLDSSHEWNRHEIIAEDYRLLFGTPGAAVSPQENGDIPSAAQVEGLREFLAEEFTSPPVLGDGGSTEEADPDTEPDADPEPEPNDPENGDDEGATSEPDGHRDVTFVSPSDGATLNGTVEVRLAVEGDDGGSIAVVELGGVSFEGRYHRGSGTYTVKVDTEAVPDGDVILTAMVTDLDGLVSAAHLEVAIANTSEATERGGKGGSGGGGPKKR